MSHAIFSLLALRLEFFELICVCFEMLREQSHCHEPIRWFDLHVVEQLKEFQMADHADLIVRLLR